MPITMIAMCVFVAAVLSGATGLGFPLLAVPIFLLDYAPAQAILMACICSLIGQSFAVAVLRQTVCYEIRWQLVLPGMLGVPIAAQCISLTLLCLHDTLTVAIVRAIAVYVVPLIAGVAIGAAGFRLVSSGMYSRAILAITLLSGLALLFR
jgi:uncharacterized membrane protein YfcA